MAIGVTSFISSVLAKGKKFSPDVCTKHSSEVGLAIGRMTDHLVRRVVLGSAKLMPEQKTHRRALKIFQTLRQLGLTDLKPQVPVKDEKLRIRTSIDLTAKNSTGSLVVIEVKTTQDTIAQHLDRYNKRCRNCPTLVNGLPNTEYWRHQLQCGFGMLALSLVHGIVIVACSDGVRHYSVGKTARERCMFQMLPVSGVAYKQPSEAKTLSWPTHPPSSLLKLFTDKGFTEMVSEAPIIFSGSSGLASAIIVNRHAKYEKSKLQLTHKKMLKLQSQRAFAKQGKSIAIVSSFIVFLNKGKWEIKQTGRKIKPVS